MRMVDRVATLVVLFVCSRCWVAVCFLVGATGLGCSGSPMGVPVPKFDARTSGDALVEKHDTNGDELLDEQEFAKCYGMVSKFNEIDADGDSSVSSDELAARIRSWTASGLGATGVLCHVYLDKRPLVGATVILQPLEFFGDTIVPAVGTTDDRGKCTPTMDPTKLPKELSRVRGVQPGLYQVLITHDSIDIPEQYNQQSILGVEVSRTAILPQGVRFDLNGEK